MKTVGDYQYREEDELGRGSFSRVYLGTPLVSDETCGSDGGTHLKVAIKVMELPKSDGKTKHLLREIELMRHLKHRNIVRLIDVKYEKFGHTGLRIFIVMEYCSKGDMASLPKPMAEEECRHYFRGIFSGLRYLKKRQIIHRDIKPQNILLTHDNVVKIADFTFSKQIEENELLQTQCGTPLFISPDVMFGQPYTDKSDLYSCGVMLYQFLYGTHPLGTVKSQADLVQKMKRAKITFPQKLVHESYERPDSSERDDYVLCRTIRIFSREAVQLCKGLLKFNPSDRISWEAIYHYPWLNLEPMEPDELFPPDLVSQDLSAAHGQSGERVVHAFSAPSQLDRPRVIPVPRELQQPSQLGMRKPLRKSTAPRALGGGNDEKDTAVRQPSFEQFKFDGSTSGGKTETSQQSSRQSTRIIFDYYSTSPDTGIFNLPNNSPVDTSGATDKYMTAADRSMTTDRYISVTPPAPKPTIDQQQKDKSFMSTTLFTKSIDAIQKVFSL